MDTCFPNLVNFGIGPLPGAKISAADISDIFCWSATTFGNVRGIGV